MFLLFRYKIPGSYHPREASITPGAEMRRARFLAEYLFAVRIPWPGQSPVSTGFVVS